MVICLERGADLHMAELIPLPLTVSCSSKSRLVLVLPAHLGSAGQNPEGCKMIVVEKILAAKNVSEMTYIMSS